MRTQDRCLSSVIKTEDENSDLLDPTESGEHLAEEKAHLGAPGLQCDESLSKKRKCDFAEKSLECPEAPYISPAIGCRFADMCTGGP